MPGCGPHLEAGQRLLIVEGTKVRSAITALRTGRTHGAGTKRFHHPVVGELVLAYEELAVTAEPGQVLVIYTPEPGSPSAERLKILASWAAGRAANHA